jgi:hypothetical protein
MRGTGVERQMLNGISPNLKKKNTIYSDLHQGTT